VKFNSEKRERDGFVMSWGCGTWPLSAAGAREEHEFPPWDDCFLADGVSGHRSALPKGHACPCCPARTKEGRGRGRVGGREPCVFGSTAMGAAPGCGVGGGEQEWGNGDIAKGFSLLESSLNTEPFSVLESKVL